MHSPRYWWNFYSCSQNLVPAPCNHLIIFIITFFIPYLYVRICASKKKKKKPTKIHYIASPNNVWPTQDRKHSWYFTVSNWTWAALPGASLMLSTFSLKAGNFALFIDHFPLTVHFHQRPETTLVFHTDFHSFNKHSLSACLKLSSVPEEGGEKHRQAS